MHLGVLSQRQRARQLELRYCGRHAQQLGHTKHNEPRRPRTTIGAIHILQAQIDAVVAPVARALGLHDQHDDGAEYLVHILLDLGRELDRRLHMLLDVLALVGQVSQ